jgi:hypothetical protein
MHLSTFRRNLLTSSSGQETGTKWTQRLAVCANRIEWNFENMWLHLAGVIQSCHTSRYARPCYTKGKEDSAQTLTVQHHDRRRGEILWRQKKPPVSIIQNLVLQFNNVVCSRQFSVIYLMDATFQEVTVIVSGGHQTRFTQLYCVTTISHVIWSFLTYQTFREIVISISLCI